MSLVLLDENSKVFQVSQPQNVFACLPSTIQIKAHWQILWVFSRLNKIGKDPNLLAHREEDMGSESKTINAVVNALAAEAEHGNMSQESVAKFVSENRDVRCSETNRKRTLLPRPKSENNFASPDLGLVSGSSNDRPLFYKSDTIHKQMNMQWRHSTH